ncbi:hypothetical protein YC2023_026623 [Brassica napus]
MKIMMQTVKQNDKDKQLISQSQALLILLEQPETTRVKPQDKFNQVSPKWLQAGIDGNGWLPPRSSVWRRTPTNKLKLPQYLLTCNLTSTPLSYGQAQTVVLAPHPATRHKGYSRNIKPHKSEQLELRRYGIEVQKECESSLKQTNPKPVRIPPQCRRHFRKGCPQNPRKQHREQKGGQIQVLESRHGTEVLGGAPHNHPSLRSERRSSTKPLNQHNRETRLEGNTRQEKRRSRRVTVSGESQISDLTQIRAQTVTTSRSKGSRVNFNSSHLASVPERSKDALLSVRSDGEAPSNPEQPNREERRGGDNKGERRYQKRENQETRGDRIYGPATARKLRRWRARGRES